MKRPTFVTVFTDIEDLSQGLGIAKLHLIIPTSSSFAFKNPEPDIKGSLVIQYYLVPPFANSEALLFSPH